MIGSFHFNAGWYCKQTWHVIRWQTVFLNRGFIQDLIEKSILKAEPAQSNERDATARRAYLSDRLRRMDPNSQNEFFGEIAVLYAFMSPLFQMDVESRCASGLMRSCSDKSYRYGFEQSMFQEQGFGQTDDGYLKIVGLHVQVFAGRQ